MTQPPTWRKSSHSTSGTSGECVELAALPTGIGVRDSKRASSGHLTFSSKQFSKILNSTKAGELDL